ncbi:hypothetical protein [Shouchella sp. 1P01AA]|uniref:hypothetical protein n=2 Tax=unclassified Shouchella TaxID=2893065 RepID=UPI00399F2038
MKTFLMLFSAATIILLGGCMLPSMDAHTLLEDAFNTESEFIPFELILEDSQGWKTHVFAASETTQRIDYHIQDSLRYTELYDGHRIYEIDYETNEVMQFERDGKISTGRNYLVNEIDFLAATHEIKYVASKKNKWLNRKVFHIEFYQNDQLDYEFWVDKHSLVVLKQIAHVNGETWEMEASYFKLKPEFPEELFHLNEHHDTIVQIETGK